MVVLFLVIYSGITFYLGWSLKKWLLALSWFRFPIVYWIGFYIVSFSIIIGRIHEALRIFSVIGNYWMYILQYGLILVLCAQFVIWLTPLKSISIVGSAVIGVLIVLFIVGTYNAYSPVVRNLEFTIEGKSDEEKKIRFVVASDFHLGLLSGKNHLARFVELSNEAKPDVILLVGDLVDDDPIWFVENGMAEVMKKLKSTYGVYGVLGNHEYYGGKIPLLVQEMKDAGVKILVDETVFVGESFYLTGQADITNKKRQSLDTLKPSNSDLPWIVMNHTPNDLNTPANAGVDFHMSGHTHKGQMWPNNFITNRIFELDYGYKLKGQMHALVSSGFGFWGPPIRIGSRSELWVVDVHLK